MTPLPQPGDLYIACNGNDGWSGTLPEPNAEGTDGPLASVSGAKLMVFELRRRGRLNRALTVWVRGGRYQTLRPMTFDDRESGPLTIAAYPGETPVFDGGFRIDGWQTTNVNGQAAWVADVAPLLTDRPDGFRSLFVDGRRAPRTRLPKTGYYKLERSDHLATPGFFRGSRRIVAAAEDFRSFRNLTDVDVVCLHWWVEERMPVVSFDEQRRLITTGRTSMMSLDKGTRYYVENTFEGLTEPGEWYLDRPAAKLYYLPLPGQAPDKTEVVVPMTLQFVRITGDADAGRYVEGITLRGLSFEHSDWVQPEAWCQWYDPYTPRHAWRQRDSARHFIKNNGGDPHDEKATVPQSAYNCPGVIHLEAARNCTIEDCRIEHIGFYGVDLREGCTAIDIVGNSIRDTGAGGVKMDGAGYDGPPARRTGRNRVTDNLIAAGGRVFTSAMGVVSMFADANVIAHNEIHDLYQTGISVGWRWDYEPHVAHDNQVVKNRIYDLGQGVLSDMGGIYTLGVSSGTVLRGNVIHDMVSGGYGACGIYLDQASSNILVEGNVVYRVGETVSMHWGRSNTLRNNVFAFAQKQGVFLGREPHHQWVDYPSKGVRFERNVFLLDGAPAYVDYERAIEEGTLRSDLNLYWDISKADPLVYKFCPWKGEIGAAWDYAGAEKDAKVRLFTLEAWQRTGQDRHSLVADPRFVDPKAGDFSFDERSPLHQIGFEPVDTTDVGPRPREKRGR